jgi:hypothetical protein
MCVRAGSVIVDVRIAAAISSAPTQAQLHVVAASLMSQVPSYPTIHKISLYCYSNIALLGFTDKPPSTRLVSLRFCTLLGSVYYNLSKSGNSRAMVSWPHYSDYAWGGGVIQVGNGESALMRGRRTCAAVSIRPFLRLTGDPADAVRSLVKAVSLGVRLSIIFLVAGVYFYRK